MQDCLRNGSVRRQERMVVIGKEERQKMLKAHSIGPKMIFYLEEIGVERLSDLRGADAGELAMRIDIALGRKHMNRLGGKHSGT